MLFLQIIQLVEGKASAYVFASPGCKKWDTCATEAILHAVGGDTSFLLVYYFILFHFCYLTINVQTSGVKGSALVTPKGS